MSALSINPAKWRVISVCPLFFLRFDADKHAWVSTDPKLTGEATDIPGANPQLGYAMVCVDGYAPATDENKEVSPVYFHAVTSFSPADWQCVIKCYENRRRFPQDKHPFVYLLWFLRYTSWTPEQFIAHLKTYNPAYTQPLLNRVKEMSVCLPEEAQQKLSAVLVAFGMEYNPYVSTELNETVKIVASRWHGFTLYNLDVYDKIDIVLNRIEVDCADHGNPYVKVAIWLWYKGEIDNYDYFIKAFRLVDAPTQVSLIKRYMHNVRIGKTALDSNLLKQIRNCVGDPMQRYRYCLRTPEDYFELAPALLADCIVTLKESNGQRFLTYNGVLDLAVQNCDILNPQINLGMEYMLPKCNGGAVENFNFKGFVDYTYEVIRKTKQEIMRLTPREVWTGLDVFGIKESHPNEFPAHSNSSDTDKQHFVDSKQEIRSRLWKYLYSLPNAKQCEDNLNAVQLPLDQQIKDTLYRGELTKIEGKEEYTTVQRQRELQWLTLRNLNNFPVFCAPTLFGVHKVMGITCYSCVGKNCFLPTPMINTLKPTKDWRQYTLYHIAEITGFPQVQKTEQGYETQSAIRAFANTANKALRMFKALRCRDCGHLLFLLFPAVKNNYYICINNSCSQYNNKIYLNYCFNCKKDIIDSRVCKQCPNGWYVCPGCLSCCDDATYERMALKYTSVGKPLPYSLSQKMGSGHNNKNIYYCKKCGKELNVEVLPDKNNDLKKDELIMYCLNCKGTYIGRRSWVKTFKEDTAPTTNQ